MCLFLHFVFIQNWEEFESLKNEKSPGILFSHFYTNPEAIECRSPERRDESPSHQGGWRITPEKFLNFERFYVRFNVVFICLGPGFSHDFLQEKIFLGAGETEY